MSREQAVKRRRKLQQNKIAEAKQKRLKPNRSHHNAVAEKIARDESWRTKQFIMWDGEGPRDAGYALFGNSVGDEICHPFLGTAECLDLLLDCAESNPDAIHFAFGFNYDVSMILRELPHRALRALHNTTQTFWKGYEIEHVPHKWFQVKYGHTRCRVYDIRSFFGGNYQSALADFGIGNQDEQAEIIRGKSDRPEFLWKDIEGIRAYWKLELKLGPELMEKLREVFADAGYVPRSWHGPGALARMALKRHKVYDAMAVCPVEVRIASLYAFAAGRFELFRAGHLKGRIYNADKNSAYPYYATQLPNLNNGNWRRTKYFQPGRFGVYHIRYTAEPNNTRPFPLFRRLANGGIVWPHSVEGWYWTPEAELVWEDPDAEIIEGWVFDENDPNDKPMAWVAEYYNRRRRLKDAGSQAEYTLKLIINSASYGQLAQRSGWDRKNRTPPKSHQLEWAGYITSGCRAELYKVAVACGSKLVSIDTDGVYSLAPVPGVDIGSNLGQWSVTEFDDGIFWQSGMYCLATGKGWRKAKSRGIKKGSYTAEDLLGALYRDSCNVNNCTENEKHIHLTRRMFVTYGLADIHGWEQFNTWQDEPHVYTMGGGKRLHFPRACKHYCDPPAHVLHHGTIAYLDPNETSLWSVKHKLPWLQVPGEPRHVQKAMELFNANHLDDDDEWIFDE